ncbi:MAG: 50S ribosomal protein L19 [Candidatus Peribacteraceae bacterium]|nr:50S ribosomal protein L19 [Candidatus Peribacteraceae bacterium]
MTSIFLREQSSAYVKGRPEIRSGFTVRVHERIKEGDKERVQVFEGLVISVHKGGTPTDSTITVRRIASGVGVEKVFSVHSPKIEKIEVKKVAKIRRAKLFFLRGRRGKSARLSERFTTEGEFAVATAVQPETEEDVEDVIEEVKDIKEAEEAPKPLAQPSVAAEEKEVETKEEPKQVEAEEPKKEEPKEEDKK